MPRQPPTKLPKVPNRPVRPRPWASRRGGFRRVVSELEAVRAIWWAQAGQGHRLPAERDVIVIQGGKP